MRFVADLLPALAVLVPLVAGALAVPRLRDRRHAAYANRTPALVLGALVASVVGLVTTGFFGALAGFDTGAPNYLAGLPIGLAAAGLTFLAAIGSYVALARLGAGAVLVGALMGAVLVVGPVVGATALRSAADQASIAVTSSAAEARGRIFRLTIDNVVTTPPKAGSVGGSVVDVTLHADAAFSMTPDDATWPSFVVLRPGDEQPRFQSNPEPPSPRSFAAGSDTPMRLTFQTLGPGSWRLRAIIRDAAGVEYFVTVPLEIPAG